MDNIACKNHYIKNKITSMDAKFMNSTSFNNNHKNLKNEDIIDTVRL